MEVEFKHTLYAVPGGNGSEGESLDDGFPDPHYAIAYALGNNLFELENDEHTQAVQIICAPGKYTLDSTASSKRLMVPGPCLLRGPRYGARAVLELNHELLGASAPVGHVQAGSDGGVCIAANGSYVTISDLDIVSARPQDGYARCAGIGFDSARGQTAQRYTTFKRLRLFNFEADPVYFRMNGGGTHETTIEDCEIYGKGDLVFMAASGTTAVDHNCRLLLKRNLLDLRGPNGITNTVIAGSSHHNSGITASIGRVTAVNNTILNSTDVETRGGGGATSSFLYYGVRALGTAQISLAGTAMMVDPANIMSDADRCFDIHASDTSKIWNMGRNSWRRDRVYVAATARMINMDSARSVAVELRDTAVR